MNKTFACAALAAPLAVAALGASVTLATAAATPAGAALPSAIEPGPHETLVETLAAAGAQIYECRATPADAAQPHRWVFVAPQARLEDARGRVVGTHGAGPHWRAHDGSRLDGTVKARADAPVPGAIPWLLLATTASGTTPGRFAGVSSVQRVNTSGGAAPATPCDAATVGTRAHVPYTADYRLFRTATAATPAAAEEPVPGTRRAVYLPAQFEAEARAAGTARLVPTF